MKIKLTVRFPLVPGTCHRMFYKGEKFWRVVKQTGTTDAGHYVYQLRSKPAPRGCC